MDESAIIREIKRKWQSECDNHTKTEKELMIKYKVDEVIDKGTYMIIHIGDSQYKFDYCGISFGLAPPLVRVFVRQLHLMDTTMEKSLYDYLESLGFNEKIEQGIQEFLSNSYSFKVVVERNGDIQFPLREKVQQ